MKKVRLFVALGLIVGLVAAGVLLYRLGAGSLAPVVGQLQPVAASSGSPASAHQKQVALRDLGMTCSGCAISVERQLDGVPGVISYRVDFYSDAVRVVYDPSRVSVEEIVRAIAELGYQPREVVETE